MKHASSQGGERQALLEAEAKLAAISRSQLVIELDLDGRIISANENFLVAMGYEAEEVIGQHHRMFVRPGVAESDGYKTFWSDLNAGCAVNGEYQRLGKGGVEVWIQGSYNPILGADGRPFKIVTYASVVTDDRLRTADYSGQIAAIGKSQAVIEFDMHGAIIAANDMFLETFGYVREEVVGRHHAMFLDRETSQDQAYAAFWSALRRGEYAAGEYKRIGRGGREIWIQATYNPILDLNGRPFKVVKYASDVTAARLTNADHAGQMSAINKSQAVIEFDLEGHVLFANENFLKVSGYGRDEIMGRHHRLFMDPEQVKLLAYEDFWSDLRAGVYHAGEYRRLAKGGREVWLQASYNPITDLNGKPIKVVKYATDITDMVARKQAEAKAHSARAVAESAAAAKSDFLANMSHELRTPLTSILGFSRLLSAKSGLAAGDREYVELIRAAGETLLAVVNDILDFSKLEAGAATLSPEGFSMRALVEGACSLLRQQAVDKGLRLQCTVHGDAALLADSSRLRQVLLNLIGNAVKFTEKGRVKVEARAETLPDGRALLDIQVSDTGIGVAADKINALFDRFTQADGSVARRFGGTGLGLSISRQLVELMGGQIGAHSNGDAKGSTFWFRIPLPRAVAVEAVVEEQTHTASGRHLRVLMADDHATNRVLVGALLAPFDITLDVVADGRAAVDQSEDQPYDLILMDMQMPVMDGMAAARAIRAGSGSCKHTPIVALSANILPEHVRKCLDAGMQGHVAKPVDPTQLMNAIATHCWADDDVEAKTDESKAAA